MVELAEEDLVLAPLFTLAAATGVGLADVSLLGTSLSSVATTVEGVDVTWAFLLSIGALLGAYLTDRGDISSLSEEEKLFSYLGLAIIGATLAAPEAVKSVGDASGLAPTVFALGLLGIEAGAFWAIAYQE